MRNIALNQLFSFILVIYICYVICIFIIRIPYIYIYIYIFSKEISYDRNADSFQAEIPYHWTNIENDIQFMRSQFWGIKLFKNIQHPKQVVNPKFALCSFTIFELTRIVICKMDSHLELHFVLSSNLLHSRELINAGKL